MGEYISYALVIEASGSILEIAKSFGIVHNIQSTLHRIVMLFYEDLHKSCCHILFHAFYLAFCQHKNESFSRAFVLPK